MRFQALSYDENRSVKESELIWYPIYSEIRNEIANSVQITNLKLKDTRFFKTGLLNNYDYEIFGIHKHTVRPYEYPDNVHVAITYEFDLNLYRIDREAYNIFDWLGDIGGIFVALLSLLKGVLIFVNY